VGPGETDFFYIGTNDRDSYTFETVDLPDGFEASKYTFKDSVLIAK
jgi:hypothetical protein